MHCVFTHRLLNMKELPHPTHPGKEKKRALMRMRYRRF